LPDPPRSSRSAEPCPTAGDGAGTTELVLGVIGHVDHGKTALVHALTGRWTDRLPEEKERGISIALGFAHVSTRAGAEIDLIDMPGHERFVRTMISGATGTHAVLLVVAANEGIQPQTVEHIEIAGLLGIPRAIVAITKTDLVAPAEAARVAAATLDLLARSGIRASPPVMTSARTGHGLDALRDTLEALVLHQPRRLRGPVYLPVDRAFGIVGHGPVVTGTLRGGTIAAEEPLELLPLGRTVRVRAVQVRGASVAAADPGRRVALNLRDIDIAMLHRGMVLASPDTLAPSTWLSISVRALESAPALKNGARLRALMGTTERDVRLRLLDHDALEPGQTGFAQLHCPDPVFVPAREHVILRTSRTVAGGRILETEARRMRRNAPAVLERLDDLLTLDPAAMIAAEVARSAASGIALTRLARLAALTPSTVRDMLAGRPVVVTRTGVVVEEARVERLRAEIPALLADHEAGLSGPELLTALAAGAPVLDEALRTLIAEAVVARSGGRLVVPRPDVERRRARRAAELAAEIAGMLRSAGLTPPRPAEIVTDVERRRAVDRLVREGVVIRAVDRAKGREILFHRDAVAQAKRRLEPLLADGPGLPVTEIGAALGISRKYSMPLLDHLDTTRFTRRIDDRRVLHAPSGRPSQEHPRPDAPQPPEVGP
jgi:selenocysteine-specific elongation factor